MDRDIEARPQYDIPTAVTFLIAGLGARVHPDLAICIPFQKGDLNCRGREFTRNPISLLYNKRFDSAL
jgi:hypothetical protein